MQKINIDICKKCKNFLEFPSKKEGWKKAICGIAHAIIYFEQEYHAISDGDFEIPSLNRHIQILQKHLRTYGVQV